MKFLAGLTVASLCLTGLTSFGKSSSQGEAIKEDLSQVSALKMPAKAAQIVSAAGTFEKDYVTISVVLAALDLQPTAAVAVVGEIVKRNPGIAATAAAAAAVRQPKQAEAILQAAVRAAPSQVGKIVFAVCRALPTKYNSLAVAAHRAAPGADKEILEAIGSAVPAMKPLIQRAMTKQGKSSSFPEIIAQTESMLLAGARAANTGPESMLTSNRGSTPAFTQVSIQVLPPPPIFNPPHTPKGNPPENNPQGQGNGHSNHGNGHGYGHGHHYDDP